MAYCKDTLYKDIAPSVINTEMILKAIDEQRPIGEAGRLAREDGIFMDEIKNLRLEFLNILRIDHLWILTGLTKLSLSNNMIEKIENLDALIHLEELDLSFNQIKIIENLDNLTNLKVLTLYSNRISVIDNMHMLKNLHIFSIGKNLITFRENIFHLRRFKKLRSVNMAENECANATDFRMFVAIFLPQITYYEYKRITEEERSVGLELFRARLKEVKESEQYELEMEAKEEAERAEAELHAESFVEFLGGRQLFDSLFDKDPDGCIFLLLDEVLEFYSEYETNFLEVTKKLFEVGQEKYESRKKEVQQFYNCVDTAKEENQLRSQEAMEEFLKNKADIISEIKAMQEIEQTSTTETNVEIDFTYYTEKMQELAESFNDLIHNTWKQLMGLEMSLFDQLEETNLTFERTLTEMVNSFIEEAQGFFTQCRSFEQLYMEQVSEVVNRLCTLQNIQESYILPDEIKPLLEDKEVLNNAVAASHDIHMQLIDAREDRLVSRARMWCENLVDNLRKNEITRNRGKILEINHFLDCQREEFEDIHQEGPIFHPDISAALE